MIPLILAISTSVFLSVAITLFAWQRPDYSHIHHTISELGEISTPKSKMVSFGVFLPVGLALAYIAFLIEQSAPNSSILAGCIAVGYVVAALFPCDTGSPLHGSLRQGLHNLGGGVEYIGGGLALWKLAESHDSISLRVSAIIVGVAAFSLSVPAFFAIRGLIQRVAEVLLFSCLVVSLVPN